MLVRAKLQRTAVAITLPRRFTLRWASLGRTQSGGLFTKWSTQRYDAPMAADRTNTTKDSLPILSSSKIAGTATVKQMKPTKIAASEAPNAGTILRAVREVKSIQTASRFIAATMGWRSVTSLLAVRNKA